MTEGTRTNATDDYIDRISKELSAGGGETVRALFAEHGTLEPRVLWSPEDKYLDDPVLRRAAFVLRGMAEPSGRLLAGSVDLKALDDLREWLVLLTVEPGGVYRYRHYGRKILEHHGIDMTGRTTAEMEEPVCYYLTGFYRAVEERGEWVLSETKPRATGSFVYSWIRLMVPLHDDDGAVTAIVTASIPVSPLRAGLELMVDPVLVVDETLTVVFANIAARRMFDIPVPAIPPVSLRSATGLRIDIPWSAEEMLARQEGIDSIELLPRAGVFERFAVTVSAASQRTRAYYVVVMRPIGN